jgi:hypothetical protein
MRKELVGRAVFAGRHRLVFEALIEHREDGKYPKDVVFAEMHENHLADNIIRLQLDAFGLYKFCRGVEEIVLLGEELLEKGLEKIQGGCRIYTRSAQTQTVLFLGAKRYQGGKKKVKIGYLVNMHRNGTTYSISFDKTEVLALMDQSRELANRLWHRCMDAQADMKNGNKKAVEVVCQLPHHKW